jgi:DNA helicase-2/ATP-dependent DNA helicase PcrA
MVAAEINLKRPREFPPSANQMNVYRHVVERFKTRSSRHLVVSAKAGSGKTSTVTDLLEFMPTEGKFEALYLTFGRLANEHLSAKINQVQAELKAVGLASPNVRCLTVHQVGARTLARKGIKGDPDSGKYKYRDIAKQWAANHKPLPNEHHIERLAELLQPLCTIRQGEGHKSHLEFWLEENYPDNARNDMYMLLEKARQMSRISDEQAREDTLLALAAEYVAERTEFDSKFPGELKELLDKVRVTLTDATDEEALIELIRRFKIEIDPLDESVWPLVLQAVPECLREGIKLATTASKMDFTDQIWLPSSQALDIRPWNYPMVIVDECQDLSPCQRELAMRSCWSKGFAVWVGDRNQAIFAFNGASFHSIDEIITDTGAEEVELDECFRCGKVIVDLAASVRPGIRSPEWMRDGKITYISDEEIEVMAQAGDFIISRTTAPLVKWCLRLLRAGKKAQVRGRDLGGVLYGMVEKIQLFFQIHPAQEQEFFANLEKAAREYLAMRVEILAKDSENNESEIDALTDRIETLIALHQAYLEKAVGGTLKGFQEYLMDFFKETVGGQITLMTGHGSKGLENERVFILNYDTLPSKRGTPDEQEQEKNLLYVMITRAQQELFLVVRHPELYRDQEEDEDNKPAEPAPIQAQVIVTEVAPLALPEPKVAEQQTVETVEISTSEPFEQPKKGRGRPKGSKNKQYKTEEERSVPMDITLPPVIYEALARVAGNKKRAEYIANLLAQDPAITEAIRQIETEKSLEQATCHTDQEPTPEAEQAQVEPVETDKDEDEPLSGAADGEP